MQYDIQIIALHLFLRMHCHNSLGYQGKHTQFLRKTEFFSDQVRKQKC